MNFVAPNWLTPNPVHGTSVVHKCVLNLKKMFGRVVRKAEPVEVHAEVFDRTFILLSRMRIKKKLQTGMTQRAVPSLSPVIQSQSHRMATGDRQPPFTCYLLTLF